VDITGKLSIYFIYDRLFVNVFIMNLRIRCYDLDTQNCLLCIGTENIAQIYSLSEFNTFGEPILKEQFKCENMIEYIKLCNKSQNLLIIANTGGIAYINLAEKTKKTYETKCEKDERITCYFLIETENLLYYGTNLGKIGILSLNLPNFHYLQTYSETNILPINSIFCSENKFQPIFLQGNLINLVKFNSENEPFYWENINKSEIKSEISCIAFNPTLAKLAYFLMNENEICIIDSQKLTQISSFKASFKVFQILFYDENLILCGLNTMEILNLKTEIKNSMNLLDKKLIFDFSGTNTKIPCISQFCNF